MLSKLIKILEGEVGYRESGTNHQKYSPAVPGLEWSQNQAWCATFNSWAYLKTGLRPNVDFPVTASCLAGVSWYKSKKRWSSTPKVGSQVFYGPGGGTHVEIVIGVSSGYITTIGGNTSGSFGGTYFNGDGVYKKTVARSNSRIYGYGTPFNLEEDDLSAKDVWEEDIVPAPRNASTYKKNPTWKAGSHLQDINERVRDLQKSVAVLASKAVDVDEDAVAAAVLASLTPEKIASAIPSSHAREVADELANRLAA